MLAVLTLGLHVYVALAPENSLMNWYTTDDAFYYFKVAQNISEGHGITFDGVNAASGFHPLWMLICIPIFALTRISLILPLRVLVIVAGLFNAGSGMLLYATFKRVVDKPIAMLMSFFWVFSAIVQANVSQLGMETSVNAFSLILLMYFLVKFQFKPESVPLTSLRQQWTLGLTALLVLFSRLDNIFLVLMVLLWLVYVKRQRRYIVLFASMWAIISIFLSFVLRAGYQFSYIQYLPAIYWMLGVSLIVKMIVYALSGLFDLPHRRQTWTATILHTLLITGLASIIVAGIMLLVYQAGVFDRFPRTVVIIDWVLSSFGFLIARVIWIRAMSHQRTDDTVRTLGQQFHFHLQAWFENGIVYSAIVGLPLALYMGIHKVLFGSFSPVSGQIKHWWGTIYTVYGRPVNSMGAFWGFGENLKRGPWFMGTKGWYSLFDALNGDLWMTRETADGIVRIGSVILIVIFLALLISQRRQALAYFHKLAWWPLFIGSLLQLTQYSGTGYVNTRDWYWLEQMLVILWLAVIFIQLLLNQLRAWRVPKAVPAAIMAVFALFWFGYYTSQVGKLVPATVSPENEKAYLGAIQLLEEKTELGSEIGSTGGGVIAYFIKGRMIVNLDGLMNSQEYFEAMKANKAGDFLSAMGLEYVYGNEYMVTQSDPFKDMLKGKLKKLETFGGATLFRFQ